MVFIQCFSEILALDDDGEIMNLMQEYGVETLQKFMQKYGVETVQYYIKYFQNAIEELDIKIRKIETAIRNLKAEAKDSEQLQIQNNCHNCTRHLRDLYYINNSISRYNDVKSNLLEARRVFSETVLLFTNIEIGIRDWQDEQAAVLLKNQFTQLRRLIDEKLLTNLEKNGKSLPLVTIEEIEGMYLLLQCQTNF